MPSRVAGATSVPAWQLVGAYFVEKPPPNVGPRPSARLMAKKRCGCTDGARRSDRIADQEQSCQCSVQFVGHNKYRHARSMNVATDLLAVSLVFTTTMATSAMALRQLLADLRSGIAGEVSDGPRSRSRPFDRGGDAKIVAFPSRKPPAARARPGPIFAAGAIVQLEAKGEPTRRRRKSAN